MLQARQHRLRGAVGVDSIAKVNPFRNNHPHALLHKRRQPSGVPVQRVHARTEPDALAGDLAANAAGSAGNDRRAAFKG